jgi:probable addiction module antidote protein
VNRESRKKIAAAPQEDWLVEQLRDRELAVAYLNAALEEGDQAAFMLALRNVAKASGGIATLARSTGMNRVALSRALSNSGNPELRNLTKILNASGMKIVVAAKAATTRGENKTRARSTARLNSP